MLSGKEDAKKENVRTTVFSTVSVAGIEVEVERASEGDLNLHYITNVPRLEFLGLANLSAPKSQHHIG